MADTSQISPPNPAQELSGLEANFSTLVLSIGSSAAMALGLAPNPATHKIEKDLHLARFNIDLLRMLKEKTKGNLAADEQKFIDSICTDLQMKFVAGN
jgi:hypothetical protein